MIFKIDVDGVLRDILTPLCNLYNDEFGTNIQPSDIEEYKVDISFPLIKERYGISAVEWFFTNHSFEIFRCSKPYEGVRDAMKKLHEMGYKIIIVSFQRTTQNKVDTTEWLEHNNIYYDSICFTNDKDIIKGDFMVDDYPENLYQVTDNCQPVLIDMPYNKNCHDFVRHKSFIDFVNSLV